MFRVLSVAVFRGYQYLKTYRVLYIFSIVSGKENNASYAIKTKKNSVMLQLC
jgi:hypothetical protein